MKTETRRINSARFRCINSRDETRQSLAVVAEPVQNTCKMHVRDEKHVLLDDRRRIMLASEHRPPIASPELVEPE